MMHPNFRSVNFGEKKKNEHRIEDMRKLHHINYKHRGLNKIKIYSSVTNVSNECSLLWLPPSRTNSAGIQILFILGLVRL